MWTTCLLGSILLFISYRIIKFWVLNPWSIHRDLWRQGIPGQYTPIVGELLRIHQTLLTEDPFSYTKKMVAKFGDYYHTSFGPFACLSTSDPSLIDGVLKTNCRAYHKSLVAQLLLGALLGNDNLLLTDETRAAKYI